MAQKLGTERKTLGTQGELTLDGMMARIGWERVVANRSFRGGEIDRIYRRSVSRLTDVEGAVREEGLRQLPDSKFLAPTPKRAFARTDSLARVAREAIAARGGAPVVTPPKCASHRVDLPAYCVAEVKTLRVRHSRAFDALLGGDFLARSLRFQQLRNLALCARLLSMHGVAKVHVRVFRIFVFSDGGEARVALEALQARFAANRCVRVLEVAERAVALSLTPDFVPKGQRSHPLQVEISG